MTTATMAQAELAVRHALTTVGFVTDGPDTYLPAATGESLIKIEVFGGQLQLWRRPRVTQEFTRIAVFDCADFDPERFTEWFRTWPLVENR